MKVLLSDGSHKNTLAIARYLGREGHTIHILHHKKSAPAFSKYCSSLILSPPIEEREAYVHFLISHIRQHPYDLLIPVGVHAYQYCVNEYKEINKYLKLEVAPGAAFEIAINKRSTFKFAETHGIDHPKSFYPENLEEAIALSEIVEYPAVIKSSNESVIKFPTLYADNKETLIDQLNHIYSGFSSQLDKAFPIIQERIQGDGFGFFAVYQRGVCKKVFMHKRIRENPVSGGVSTSAQSFYDEKLLQAGKKVLDALQWHGQAMVEFKQERTSGAYKLIEINPKFWGSLELSLSAGMNFPEHLCKMARGDELTYSETYHRKRRFIWLVAVNGELYRLWQKPGDIFPLIFDMLRLHSRTDFWWTDLKPTFVQIAYFVIWLKELCFKRKRTS
jgi:predicted ATP-grasp superfamily ATP-dependent carboligase